MSIPITCLMITYGREKHVASALQCFLNQTHDDKWLVILNTFPRQRLIFDHPQVTIVNLPVRPKSLGEARNLAMEHVPTDDSLAVIFDDDDGYCDNHLSNFANHFEDGTQWIWLSSEAYFEGYRMKSITMGTPNIFAFTKRAWRESGGYPERDCGEDRHLVSSISSKCKGKKISLQPYEVSFCRNWAVEGIYHVSGEGDNTRRSGHDRVAEWVDSQVNMGKIPTGDIELVPKLLCDYDKVVSDFTMAVQHLNDQKIGKIGIIYLGRTGDILNCLPIARFIAERYEKPLFFVSKQFASVLDGVSYVQPVILELPQESIKEALKFAAHKVELLINCQVWGRDFQVEKRSTFNRDSWHEAGLGSHFWDTNNFPLVIDRRDPAREQALCDRLPMAGKPTMLVNVKGGVSSPYPQAEQFLNVIRGRWASQYNVIDLSMVQAERIYDLLGVFDRAAMLITSDTATLHLAAASSIPVISLVNDIDWLGSAPRCNCVFRVKYAQALESMAIINALITELYAGQNKRVPLKSPVAYVKPVNRKIIHCVEMHPETRPDVLKRKQKAWDSWKYLYDIGVIPAHYENYKRDSSVIGDNRGLPFLKDVLEFGLSKATSEFDIVAFSNDDNILHPDIGSALAMFCSIYSACTSQRREFKTPYPTVKMSPESLVAISQHHMGRDMFACTAGYLRKHWNEIPDFLLGTPVFDLCLAAMVRKHRGFSTNRQNIEEIIPCCELMLGYVSHESHDPVWDKLPLHHPSIAWNNNLFQKWGQQYAPEIRIPL